MPFLGARTNGQHLLLNT